MAQSSDTREERKNQAVLGLFAKLDTPKEKKQLVSATK
jgi:hypothetical protein